MRKNILKLNFSKLRKLEAQYLANSVIEIVERNDPETLNIKEIFDILVAQTPQIELLKIGYGSHPITHDLGILRTRRNAYAQGIINKLQTIDRAKERELEGSLKVAKPIVFRYLYQLPKSTEKDIRQTLIQFFDFIKVDSKLSTAITALDLTNQVANLQVVSSDIDTHYIDRRVDISARPKDKTPDIVSVIKKHILDLFKQIEVAQIKHTELDYTALIDELNNMIANMKADLKARASYNKKKAEEALNNKNTEVVEKQDEVIVEPASEEPSTSTQSTERMYPTNVEVDNEENLEQLDIKKTAAVSTKQTRLPIVSPEA